MTIIYKIMIVLLLGGWTLPLFLSITFIISFLSRDKTILNSFPYLEFAKLNSIIFIIWALISLITLVYILYKHA